MKLESLAAVGKLWLQLESLNKLGKLSFKLKIDQHRATLSGLENDLEDNELSTRSLLIRFAMTRNFR